MLSLFLREVHALLSFESLGIAKSQANFVRPDGRPLRDSPVARIFVEKEAVCRFQLTPLSTIVYSGPRSVVRSVVRSVMRALLLAFVCSIWLSASEIIRGYAGVRSGHRFRALRSDVISRVGDRIGRHLGDSREQPFHSRRSCGATRASTAVVWLHGLSDC